MLKTVSSITNAIGALNYKGTWNANTNSPALASGVGTKGDYYVVGTAGATALDGISNWGIGDWAVFNGTAWQRVEGGADLNGVNLSFSGTSSGASGSVGAPAYSFTGDPDTGFWRPGDGQVALSSDGVETWRQASNKNHGFGGINTPSEKVASTSLAIEHPTTTRSKYRARVWYSQYVAAGGNQNICKIESDPNAYAITGPSVKIKTFYTYAGGFTNTNYAEYLIQPRFGANPNVLTLFTNGGPPTITVTQSGTEATIAVTYVGDAHLYVMAEVFGTVIEWYI